MSFFKSNKLLTFICLMASALLLTLGIIAFLPTAPAPMVSSGIISAINVNFDMFKSFSALKTWLAAIPYYVYLCVALVLFVISFISIIFAVCKKARHRRNDVNVLILVGDEDEKVDATVFKEHYAVVVVAKPSSLTPVQPRVLPPIVPLENNRRYIPIPNDNPTQNVEKEDIITIVEPQEIAEQTAIAAKPIENVDKEPIQQEQSNEQAIAATQEKNKVPTAVTEKAIKQPEKAKPSVVEQTVNSEPKVFDTQEELVEDTFIVESEPIIESEPIKQVNKNTATQTVNMDDVFEQAYSDVNTTKMEEEVLYDESEFVTDNFEEVNFDQNEFNVSPIIINSIAEFDEEKQLDNTDSFNNFECITVQEDIKPKIKETVSKAESSYDVQEFEPIMFMQNYQNDSSEMVFEQEDKTEDIPLADIAIQDNERNNLLLVSGASVKTNTEDAAYAIIKEKNATEEAISATQNGAIIVDADGDDVVDEVLEDKDILKLRYKTVELDKRLKRTSEEVKGYYSDLKNALLSYKGVKSRLSKKFDTFTLGRFIIAKLALRGNIINLYLALPNEQVDDKYYAEDVGDSDTYGKTPTLHKVKSKRGCKYGVELIHELMTAIAVEQLGNFQCVDYAAMYPPENIEEKKKEIEHLMTDRAFIEDTDVLTDEEAIEYIQIVKNKDYTINKFNPINKFVAFIDDIAELYEQNETVTIENLVAKGALPDMENLFLEIRGKGYLDKKLTVEAHSFDIKAVKMITLLNGNVIQYK